MDLISDLVWTFVSIAALSALLTFFVIDIAASRNWTAEPNERSSHTGLKPIGGGGVILFLVVVAWLLLSEPFDQVGIAVVIGVIALAIISWIDDLKTVNPIARLLLQFLAVGIVLTNLPQELRILPELVPLGVERLLTGLLWVWFINLYNFMDGIDGLAASETITICVGIVLIGVGVGLSPQLSNLALVLGGATMGFIPWNWHRSRIMLGDLGAIPIGFLLGFLLLNLVFHGYLAAAIILPLYFVVDASFTLARQILAGKKFWQPHKNHLYQRAAMAINAHDQVVVPITAANVIFVGAAFWSTYELLWASLLALVTLAILIGFLVRMATVGTR